MGDVVGFLQAVGLTILILGLGGALLYWIKKGFSFLLKNVVRSIKKKDPKKYEWCIEAIKDGHSEEMVLKTLLLNDAKKKEIDEMIYIYRKCEKILKKEKGGKK